jgi:hypothetical protein
MLRKFFWLSIILLLELPIASAQQLILHTSSKATPHTLSSGRQVKIIGEARVHLQNSIPAIMLKYETDISIDDFSSLKQEAEEVWKDFKDEVEKKGYTTAVLSADHFSNVGKIRDGKGYNFVLIKNRAGTWDFVK